MDTPTAIASEQTDGRVTESTAERDPVMEGLRQELIKLVQGELTAPNLYLLVQTAQLARDMLALRNPRLGRRVRSRRYGGAPYDEDGSAWEPSESEPFVAEGMPNPVPYPSKSMDRETFGAKIVRELVAVLPEISRAQREDPAQLVRALAEARAAGLEDVASELHARLSGRVPQPSSPQT